MNKSKEMIKVLRWMLAYAAPYKKWLVLNIAAIAMVTAFNLLKVYYVQQLIDRAVSRSFEHILYDITGILIAVSIGTAATYLARLSQGKYGIHAARDMKAHFALHSMQLPIRDLETNHSGKAISCFNNDLELIGGFLGEQFSSTFSMILMFICAVLFMVSVSWKLLLVSLVFLPLCMLAMNKMSRKIGSYSKEKLGSFERANRVILDALNGIDIVKSYQLEQKLFNRCKDAYEKAAEADIKSSRLSNTMLAFMIAVFNLPYVVCIIVGGYMAWKGEILIGSLVAFTQLLEYIIDPVLMYKDVLSGLRDTASAVQRVDDMLRIAPELQIGLEQHEVVNQSAVEIEFDDVCFGYQDQDSVIDRLSFTVRKGETVALVGSSGGGKSTVLNLICGFYEANKGSVKVLGTEIKAWKPSELRKQLAVVSQNTYLFPGTVEENVGFGRVGASREDIHEAAGIAYLDDFIKQTKEGYATEAGEGGSRLSGGQRQRIAIARAVLKDAPILLLDEPTASLDNESEAVIQQALDAFSKDKTVLVVAHRLSTVRMADKILVLESGRIVETGAHDELMELNGRYKQLYSKQLTEPGEGLQKEA